MLMSSVGSSQDRNSLIDSILYYSSRHGPIPVTQKNIEAMAIDRD